MESDDLKDLDDVLDSLKGKNIKDAYDYQGYAVLDRLELSTEELKQAVSIMWEIVMTMDNNQRQGKYLFSKGLIRSKTIFLSQKEKSKLLTGENKETFDLKTEIFRERLENVKPLVNFLIKIKEIL
jgi:hypothetical protein